MPLIVAVFRQGRIAVFAIFAVHIALRLVLMLAVMMLFWDTSPFKHGLLGVLASQFKYVLIMSPVSLLVMIVVRVMKLVATIKRQASLDLWSESSYIIFILLHNLGKFTNSRALDQIIHMYIALLIWIFSHLLQHYSNSIGRIVHCNYSCMFHARQERDV